MLILHDANTDVIPYHQGKQDERRSENPIMAGFEEGIY